MLRRSGARRGGLALSTTPRASGRRLLRPTPTFLVWGYVAVGAIGATGGARPTGIGWLDAVLLGVGGVAAAACARRARTVPVYVAAGVSAALQPEAVPLVLGLVALVAAFSRRSRRAGALAGILAGGLAWAAAVGAPLQPGAQPIAVPMLAFAWVIWSARSHASGQFRTRLDRWLIATGGVALVCAVLGAVAIVSAKAHVDRGADLLESGLEAARQGDSEGAVADLRAARRALDRGDDSLGALWARPAWLVPGVSQNARALRSLVGEVGALAEVGIVTSDEADIATLRASNGQIDLAAVAAVEEPLARAIADLQRSDEDLAGLEDAWLLSPVRSRLAQVRDELAEAIPSAELALEGVRVAPGLLGGEGTRTYLVLFTTPVEGRATTGFPGNYAEVTFTDGHFEKTRFGRVSDLNEAGVPLGDRVVEAPEDYLRRYARFDATQEWRSITFSPDFPTVAQVAAQLYPQSGGKEVDGVLSLDPTALGALLTFTGPIAVPGLDAPLTAETAAEFLLRDQYVELPDTPERIDLLESLSEATFDRLVTVELPGPQTMGEVLGPMVTDGHLQLLTFDAAETSFLDQLGTTGGLPPVEGDFVGLTTSNAAMNKIDLFLERTLNYEVVWDPGSGALDAVATITLTNTAPASGLPDYILGNAVGQNRPGGVDLPDGWNNLFVTLYTPWLPANATLDGQPLPLEVLPELGRQAVSTFVELGPGASATIRIELEGSLDQRRYVLDLAGQAMVVPDDVTVRLRSVAGGDLRVTGPVEADGRKAEGTFPLVSRARITASE